MKIKDPFHFIGIGGAGMSVLAEIARRRGFSVRGSDVNPQSAAVARLRAQGVEVTAEQQAGEHKKAGTVIVSSAIPKSHPALIAARDEGMPVLHRSEFLGELMQGKSAITVAGSHGKSSCSAMISFALKTIGVEIESAVGAQFTSDIPADRADASLMVAEADESDGSFLRYNPYISVMTNIGCDHLDYFGDERSLVEAFRNYLEKTDPEGCAVVGWDDPRCREIALATDRPRLAFGTVIGCDIRGLQFRMNAGSSLFTAAVERDVFEIELPLIGLHNMHNALCCLAVIRALELKVEDAAEALRHYPGIKRRLEPLYRGKRITILDDYAHNPGKITAAIQAVKQAWPEKTLHVVFQAHRYSRLETMYHLMIKSLSGADNVHVVPVYSSGESTDDDFSPNRLANDIHSESGCTAIPCDDFEAAQHSIERSTKSGSHVVLTVGAGDIWKLARNLAEANLG